MQDQSSNEQRGSNNPRNAQRRKPTRRRVDPHANMGNHPVAPAAGAAGQAHNPRTAAPAGNNPRAAARSNDPRAAARAAAAQPAPRPADPAAEPSAAQQAPQKVQPEAAPVQNAQPQQPVQRKSAPQGQKRRSGYNGIHDSIERNPRVVSATPAAHAASPYIDTQRYSSKGKSHRALGIIFVLIAIIGLGVGAYLYLNPPTFNVTINGMTRTVNNGTTLSGIVEEGVVSPKAGDLLAVTGKVLEKGAGDPFTATVNGEEVKDAAYTLHKNDVVQIDNGGDVTEPYDVEVVEKEPKQREVGWGAIHVYIPGEAGTVEKRTGQISGKTKKVTTKETIDNVFLHYDADTGGDKVVALTFDDGPWPTTGELLDVLKENDAVATFFTIGEQIADYPDFVKREAKEGHQIATHTYDHASGSGGGVDLTHMTADEQIAEVTKGYDAIKAVTNENSEGIMRAPGGNYYGDIIWTLQPHVKAELNWNVDTEDWARPGASVIAERIKSAKPGDIVLMHDGGGDRSQTIEALKTALPYLKEKGYKFITIDELLAYNDPLEVLQKIDAQEKESE